jgi:SPP1 family predicted phage head-tail adaptor
MISQVTPGDLRVELMLEQAQESPDGAGGYSEAWNEVGPVFAEIGHSSAEHRFGAHQSLEEITHHITIRYRTDVASGMRMRRGERLFSVVSVHDPDETGRYLVIRAREQGR